jgi:hypothetical protein
MPDRDVVRDGLPGALTNCATSVFCSHCNTDLTDLPFGARYCRHCGVRLPFPAARIAPREPYGPGGTLPAEGQFNWRFWWWGGAPRVQQSRPGDRTSMLLAYAKSMFGLGWRYEHAVGSRRNFNEAARCYWKAARLGNPSALSRFNLPTTDGDSDLAGSQAVPNQPAPLARLHSPSPDSTLPQ